MLAAVKNTTPVLLALALLIGLTWPARLGAATPPDDMRGDDEAATPAPSVHPLDRQPPPTNDPENKFLPPEIREDIERPMTKPLPGEADADDGANDPEPAPSAAASPAADASPAAEAPPVKKTPKPRPSKKPWKRPAPPADAADAPTAPHKKSAAQVERERKKAEREAKKEAAELERLNREADAKDAATTGHQATPEERNARAEERKAARKAAKAARAAKPAPTTVAALAPGSDSSAVGPLPAPSPAPTPGKKKGRNKRGDKSGASPAPGAPPEKAEKLRGHHRDTEFKRTGEEASIIVTVATRNTTPPAPAPPGYVDALKAMLAALVDGARNPMEAAIAFPYLGFVGDRSHVARMYERIDDPKLDDGEKLPLIAGLVEGYDDRSRLPRLQKIADDPKAAHFQRLWALEILAQAGDRSRIGVCQALIDDRATDPNDRMRALQVLAQLGDDSRRDVAKRLGNDPDLFLATRMQALACLARMEKNAAKGAEGVNELKRAMSRSKLSIEERLSIALDLVQVGETDTREFFEHVVESESDTIFDQLRALHGLALLGVSEHLGLLQDTFRTKKRPRNSARRILVLMGDRSHVPDLLDDARTGDLEAVRTLVLAALLDQQKVSVPQLLTQPRFRNLIAP